MPELFMNLDPFAESFEPLRYLTVRPVQSLVKFFFTRTFIARATPRCSTRASHGDRCILVCILSYCRERASGASATRLHFEYFPDSRLLGRSLAQASATTMHLMLIVSLVVLLVAQLSHAQLDFLYSVQRHGARNVLPKSALLTETDANGGPTLLPQGQHQTFLAGE